MFFLFICASITTVAQSCTEQEWCQKCKCCRCNYQPVWDCLTSCERTVVNWETTVNKSDDDLQKRLIQQDLKAAYDTWTAETEETQIGNKV